MDQTKLLQTMKLFLSDMDGTLYLGDQLYSFTTELLKTIKATGGKSGGTVASTNLTVLSSYE